MRTLTWQSIATALRWIAVIPGALFVAYVCVYPLHCLLYYLAHDHTGILDFITLPLAWLYLIESYLYPFIMPLAIVLAGFHVAPKHKLATSVSLAVLLVLFQVYSIYTTVVYLCGITGEMQRTLSLHCGIQELCRTAGLFLGLFIVWRKSKSVVIAPAMRTSSLILLWVVSIIGMGGLVYYQTEQEGRDRAELGRQARKALEGMENLMENLKKLDAMFKSEEYHKFMDTVEHLNASSQPSGQSPKH